MATKKCLICSRSFMGRADARTCSSRCRKRLQLVRQGLQGSPDNRLPVTGTRAVSGNRLPVNVRTSLMTIAFLLSSFLVSVSLPTQGVALAKGYASGDLSLQKGMVVKLHPGSDDNNPVVEKAQYADADKVFGVVVDLTDSLATESPVGSNVYVEQSGRAQALVSDLNGKVKKGDLLTMSSLSGVLMRSNDRSVTTVGTALEDFPGEASQSVDVKDSSGNFQKAEISLIDINVNILPPSSTVVRQNSNNLLDRLSSGLVGREINGLRVLAALAIFATLLVIESEIIYGTITTSILAVGRNPLARSLIGRESFKSVSVGIIVLIVGTVAITVLLWV